MMDKNSRVLPGGERSIHTVNNQNALEALSREQLVELLGIYSKNWLALDGLWFQSVERKLGMDEAMEHDREAWRDFTAIEARRIKAFLGLPEQAGLEGLARALSLRLYANLNREAITIHGSTLTYRVLDCRVQAARPAQGHVLPPVQIRGTGGVRRLCPGHRPPHLLPVLKLLPRGVGRHLRLCLAVHPGGIAPRTPRPIPPGRRAPSSAASHAGRSCRQEAPRGRRGATLYRRLRPSAPNSGGTAQVPT